MICKYCNSVMEYNSSEGIGFDEAHNYVCNCGASCTVYENNDETAWEEGDN